VPIDDPHASLSRNALAPRTEVRCHVVAIGIRANRA
jgi:hypothetical protein